jgi:hypothetical protein
VDLSALLIGIVILAGTVYFVSRPLLQSKRQTNAGGADVSSLEAQRESLYAQIKELDMDHATGKVNDEDYAPMRTELVAQAAAVLKQLDGVATTSSTPTPATSPVAAQTDEVEAMIAARRKPRSSAAANTTAEAAIAARRKTATPVANSAMCPKCGKPITAEDAFCAKCGAALQPQTAR